MGNTSAIAPLNLVASLDTCEHPTMLLHMLAQLPNDARLTLIGGRAGVSEREVSRGGISPYPGASVKV